MKQRAVRHRHREQLGVLERNAIAVMKGIGERDAADPWITERWLERTDDVAQWVARKEEREQVDGGASVRVPTAAGRERGDRASAAAACELERQHATERVAREVRRRPTEHVELALDVVGEELDRQGKALNGRAAPVAAQRRRPD